MFDCHLDSDVFEVVKKGIKNVEVRVYDKKRRKMKIGDEIVFLKRPLEQEKIITKIIGLKTYSNFNELVKDYNIERLYLDTFTKKEFVKLLGRFYSEEEQEEFGVVAIEFEVI